MEKKNGKSKKELNLLHAANIGKQHHLTRLSKQCIAKTATDLGLLIFKTRVIFKI